jgi:hypothetical protein
MAETKKKMTYKHYKDVISAKDKAWKSEARKLMENGIEFLVIHLTREDFQDSKFLRQEFDYVGRGSSLQRAPRRPPCGVGPVRAKNENDGGGERLKALEQIVRVGLL